MALGTAYGGVPDPLTVTTITWTTATGPIVVSQLNSGTNATSSTFWRGDGTWVTPSGSGDVSKVGTPVNDQVGVWTGDGTIEGTTSLTFNGTVLSVGSVVVPTISSSITFTNKTINGAANTLTVRLANDVTGNLSVGNLNSGTSAAENFYWMGDATWNNPFTKSVTLTNKTIDLGSNTVTGSIAEFDTALQSDTFVFTSEVGSVVQAFGAVLDDFNTLGAASADGEVIVATGAGAFAYESGATLRTSIGVGTGDSPQFTAVNVGAATDTTLTRVSAGVIAIEGATIPTFSDKLSVFAATTSAELAGVISDETGSGLLVFGTSPALTSPVFTTPQLEDTSADHQYITAVSELTADRTVTMPLLIASDTYVFESHIQSLSNKLFVETLTATAANSFSIGDVGIIIDAGTVTLADASAVATCEDEIVVATATIAAEAAGVFAHYGLLTGLSGLTNGRAYVSETPGGTTATAPTTALAVVRPVGNVRGTNTLFINPGQTIVSIKA